MKKLLAIVLSMVMILTMTACGSSKSNDSAEKADGTESSGSDIKIGLILPNGLGDKSIADQMYEAVLAAQKKAGFKFDYSECIQETDYASFLDEYCASGDYDLIIVGTFSTEDAVRELAPKYPNQKILYFDSLFNELDNVQSVCFAKEQSAFVTGAFAALMQAEGKVELNGKTVTWDPSNTLGIINGIEFPASILPCAGAWAGMKYINPDSNVLYAAAGDWSDQSKCKEIAISQYDQGAAFIFTYLGAGFSGVANGAAEKNRYCFGYSMESANSVDPEHVAATPVDDTVGVLTRMIVDFANNGTFEGGKATEVGFTTGDQYMAYQDGLVVPKEVQNKMDDIIQKVSKGEIKIPTNFDEVKAFTDVYKQ